VAARDEPDVGRRDHPPGTAEATRSPAALPRTSWRRVLRGAVKEFQADEVPDRAAGLTYYAMLAVFPALLLVVSLVGFADRSAVTDVVDQIAGAVPGEAADILRGAVEQLQGSRQSAGLAAVLGLVGALWSASGFVGGFIRAANSVYDVPEGRPAWKTIPLRLIISAVLIVVTSLAAVIVAVTGGVARWVGDLIGVGDVAVTVWGIAKWPVLLLVLMLMIALLYWAAPNARQAGWRWVSPGSVIAALLWVLVSAGFAFYVSSFARYNKIYGTLAGVIVFLVWIWLSNLALLLGAEVDAELARERARLQGAPPEREPYLPLRDQRTLDAGETPGG